MATTIKTIISKTFGILDWDLFDSAPEPVECSIPEAEPETDHEKFWDEWARLQKEGTETDEDYWADWDIQTEFAIIELHKKMLYDIEQRIEKDWDKFEKLASKSQTKKTKQKPTISMAPFLHDDQKFRLEMVEIKVIETKMSLDEVKFNDLLNKISSKTKQQPKKNPFDNFWKIKVRQNDKTPVCKWKDPANQQKTNFNPHRYNTGIPTGTRNNLLVVDLDVKDDGVDEFKKYIQSFGKPNTLHVKTPTGGEHYYFNYSHPDAGTQQMIRSFLNNSTKFRGKGIDIRSEGGYIVAPPSIRDGRAYEVTNLMKPINIPSSLVSWLLEGHTTKKKTRALVDKPTRSVLTGFKRWLTLTAFIITILMINKFGMFSITCPMST